MEEEALLKNTHEKGGVKAAVFIIANDALDKMASQGLMANMILYLTQQYHMEMAKASNVLFFWSSACSFTPVIGAIIADSYLGRFHTIGFGSLIYLLGLILLWSTSIIPQARPPPCTLSNGTCQSASIFQSMFLCASLGLIAIGAGGIRSSALAFGVDQLENEVFQRSPAAKERYFSCYYALSTFSVIISLTCVVYIQEKMGWGVGFAVPCVLMLFGVISFYLASPLYVKFRSETNLVTGFFQVVVAAYRNRNLRLSDNVDTILYHCKIGSHLVSPTRKLRFLNNACIVIDHEKDLTRDGKATNPWSLCTVDQVERLKALIKVIPIWSTGMIRSVNISQNSFPVLQAESMDRRTFAGFTIPAASFGTFTIVFIIIWICLYDRVFLPLASKAMRRPLHLSSKTRMGIGIFLSILAVTVTAIVERFRRGQAGVPMSAMWLLPQHCLSGFSEASNMIAQIEFYFSELPRSMSSIASTLSGIGMSLASLLASLILNVVDSVSRSGGHESWISSDIDKGRYDYYYLILAGLSVANIIYFIVCSNAYGPLKEERKLGEEEEDQL